MNGIYVAVKDFITENIEIREGQRAIKVKEMPGMIQFKLLDGVNFGLEIFVNDELFQKQEKLPSQK